MLRRPHWTTDALDPFASRAFSVCSRCCSRQGSLRACARCKTAAYCNAECQKDDWRLHRRWCSTVSDAACAIRLFASRDTAALAMALYALLVEIGRKQSTPGNDVDSVVDYMRAGRLRQVKPAQTSAFEYAECLRGTLEFASPGAALQAFPLYDLEKLNAKRGAFWALGETGCELSFFLALTLAFKNGDAASGEILAMMSLLRRSCSAPGKPPIANFCLPANAALNDRGQYYAAVEPDSCNRALHDDRPACYWFLLEPAGIATPNALAADDDGEAVWRHVTAQPASSRHSFLLVRLRESFFLVQSYFGYYSYRDWLDFSSELRRDPALPAPVRSDWLRPVEPRPRHRGLRPASDLDDFLRCVESLAQPGDNARTYAAITGIVHDARTAPKRYNIAIVRLALDRL